MNWYKIYYKESSARDEKREQINLLISQIEEIIGQALIGGDETIALLDSLISRLRGETSYRNLIPPSINEAVLELLIEARQVKKDSPKKCRQFLEDSLMYLY